MLLIYTVFYVHVIHIGNFFKHIIQMHSQSGQNNKDLARVSMQTTCTFQSTLGKTSINNIFWECHAHNDQLETNTCMQHPHYISKVIHTAKIMLAVIMLPMVIRFIACTVSVLYSTGQLIHRRSVPLEHVW